MYKCSINQKICAKDQCGIFGERWRGCHYKQEIKSTRGVYKRTDAHREIWREIGLANRGKKRTQEYKNHISETLKGRPPSNKGKPMSKETREKMSRSALLRWQRERGEMKT